MNLQATPQLQARGLGVVITTTTQPTTTQVVTSMGYVTDALATIKAEEHAVVAIEVLTFVMLAVCLFLVCMLYFRGPYKRVAQLARGRSLGRLRRTVQSA